MHYRSKCCELPEKESVKLAKEDDNFSGLIESYIRELFDERNISEAQKEKLWNEYYTTLSEGVDVGFNPELSQYDPQLAHSLKYNIAEFSAFKETSFRKQLEGKLTKNGKLLPWSKFKEEAKKLDIEYRERWLKTEYHQTVATGNMVGKMKDYERNLDMYPNLKYVTAGDNRVREQHKDWDGLVLPYGHTFWKKHTPPNDWGCRCDVIQTDEEPTAKIPKGNPKKGFENNAALSGEVFNEIPYKEGLTDTEVSEATAMANRFFVKEDRKFMFDDLIKNRRPRGKSFEVSINNTYADLLPFRKYTVRDKKLLHATRDTKVKAGKTVSLDYLSKNMRKDMANPDALIFDIKNQAYLICVKHEAKMLKYVIKRREEEAEFITAGLFNLHDLSKKDYVFLNEKG